MGEDKQSRLFEFGFEKTAPVVDRAKYPVEALCSCCGKTKWLHWILDGSHVCDDCAPED